MRSPERYYLENLYPFQVGILRLVKKLGLPFYLTGGTALGRGYFNHRYSDDLDLFVNNDAGFPDAVDRLYRALVSEKEIRMHHTSVVRTADFVQIVCSSLRYRECTLKIDLVNDIAAHFGKLKNHAVLGTIDSWRNILSNKVSALYRQEPKDIADLWIIARHRRFSWKEIVGEAKEKDAGVDPVAAFEIIRSFPPQYLAKIKWTAAINRKQVYADLRQIAHDILMGARNSIASGV